MADKVDMYTQVDKPDTSAVRSVRTRTDKCKNDFCYITLVKLSLRKIIIKYYRVSFCALSELRHVLGAYLFRPKYVAPSVRAKVRISFAELSIMQLPCGVRRIVYRFRHPVTYFPIELERTFVRTRI